MSRGIVYVAWGQKHINEAIISAKLNKSGYPTCLLTSESGPCTLGSFFNEVCAVNFSEFDCLRPARIFWRKQAALLYSPFDTTLYVDSDCFIQGSVDLAFTLAEEGYFCMALAPADTLLFNLKEYVFYQGGVFCSQTPAPETVLILQKLIPLVAPSDPTGDELVFSVAMRDHLTSATLPSNFNVFRGGLGQPQTIRIFHSRFQIGDPPTKILSDHYGNNFLQ